MTQPTQHQAAPAAAPPVNVSFEVAVADGHGYVIVNTLIGTALFRYPVTADSADAFFDGIATKGHQAAAIARQQATGLIVPQLTADAIRDITSHLPGNGGPTSGRT